MGGKKAGEKKTDKGRDTYRKMKVEETNQMNVAVKVRVRGRDKKRKEAETREKGRQPEKA